MWVFVSLNTQPKLSSCHASPNTGLYILSRIFNYSTFACEKNFVCFVISNLYIGALVANATFSDQVFDERTCVFEAINALKWTQTPTLNFLKNGPNISDSSAC